MWMYKKCQFTFLHALIEDSGTQKILDLSPTNAMQKFINVPEISEIPCFDNIEALLNCMSSPERIMNI